MSRTIRRKNAWNKLDFVNLDRDWLQHMSGENPFPYISFHRRKYNGCSVEKIEKRLDAKFHSDNMFYRTTNRGRKSFAKWWVRFHMNQNLKNAIIQGTEEALDLDISSYDKALNGWWLWWD